MCSARPAWIKGGIALMLWAMTALMASASEVRTLKRIDVVSHELTEQIRLEFDGEFNGVPLVNFESGSLSIRLNQANTDPTLPSLTPVESNALIKAIRAIQIPNSDFVHLDILLRSSRMLLEHPEMIQSGRFLLMDLRRNITKSPALSNTKILTEELEQRVNDDPSFPSTFTREATNTKTPQPQDDILPLPTQDWAVTMLTLVLALLFVLLLIYIMAFLYNRFLSGNFPALKGKLRIRQVSAYHVGPKQKVVVLEMNDRMFACGITPTSINLIAELQNESDQDFLNFVPAEGEGQDIDVDHARASFIKALDRARQQSNTSEAKPAVAAKAATTEVLKEQPTESVTPEMKKQKMPAENNSKQQAAFSTSVRPKFAPKTPEKDKVGNPVMQDFASKLSERLKSLKPIK